LGANDTTMSRAQTLKHPKLPAAPNRARPRFVRLTFELPAARADEAAAIVVAHGGLGCETANAPRRADASKRAPRRALLKCYFDRLSAREIARLRSALAAAGAIAPNAQFETEAISDPGWATAWMDRFEPFTVGRFLIVPPWNRVHREGFVRIIIQPAQGFGTGHHATTAGVLRALDELWRKRGFARALDVGTGSGILAIAMRLLGAEDVVAIDIDPIALENARENANLNGVGRDLRFSLVPLSSLRHHFDLITANILSGTLIEMAPRLIKLLAPEGRLVLSGILERDARRVIAAYRPALRCLSRRTERGWTTLVMGR
jgi:ribosomal protein L11 methyltransferase